MTALEAPTILTAQKASPENAEATVLNTAPNVLDADEATMMDEFPSPQSGELQLGGYILQQELMRTGLHRVFRARHALTGEQVAVKTFLTGTRDSSAPDRLSREWQLMRTLDHRHIVRAVDFGMHREVMYLVLEYLHGSSLDQLVKEWGPLPWRRAVELTRQAAIGLDFAHRRGVIHRDVKPSNFILLRDGVLKTIDFGIAFQPAELASITLDRNERLLGTVDYLAPEQAVSAHGVDARADVYALGCTLHFLLTGRAPFAGGSLAARLLKHRDEPAPAVKDVRPDVPTRISDLCREMMAKSPDARPQAMRDICGRLHT
ncbi:MAG TPA: serine/threonine-protein kinase [Pirellulales bacterium]